MTVAGDGSLQPRTSYARAVPPEEPTDVPFICPVTGRESRDMPAWPPTPAALHRLPVHPVPRAEMRPAGT